MSWRSSSAASSPASASTCTTRRGWRFPIWIAFLVGLGAPLQGALSARKLARASARSPSPASCSTATPDHLSPSRRSRRPRTAASGTVVFIYSGRAGSCSGLGARAQRVRTATRRTSSSASARSTTRSSTTAGSTRTTGHGFVDPLTGIVLWLGVAVVGLGLIGAGGRRGCAAHARRLRHPVALVRLRRQQGAELHAAAGDAAVRRVSRGRSAFAGRRIGGARSAYMRRADRRRFVVGGRRVWNVSASPGTSSQHGRKQGEPIGSTGRYLRRARQHPGAEVLHRARARTRRTTSGATGPGDRPPLAVQPTRTQTGPRSIRPGLQGASAAGAAIRAVHARVRSGSRWRRSSSTVIRADESATSRPTARASCSTFLRSARGSARRRRRPGTASRSSPFAHCSQAVRFPSSSACCVPRIVPMSVEAVVAELARRRPRRTPSRCGSCVLLFMTSRIAP